MSGQLASSNAAVLAPHKMYARADTGVPGASIPTSQCDNQKASFCDTNKQLAEEDDSKRDPVGTQRKRDKLRNMLRRLRPSTAAMIGLAVLGERVFELVTNIG
jgi:hypothetical protein